MTSSFANSSGTVVSGLSSKVLGYLSTTVISLPGIILFIVFSIISSVFFAVDYGKITEYVAGMLPEKTRGRVTKLRAMAADIGGKYVKSYAILLTVTFVELSAGLLIMGIDNAIALGALIAFIDLLPVLGTGAVLIPWCLVLVIMGNYGLAIGMAVLYVVIIVVRNILEPRIVGRQIGVHPLAMLASMYVGLKIFGFVGIFVLPIVLLAVKVSMKRRTTANRTSPARTVPPVRARGRRCCQSGRQGRNAGDLTDKTR
jgi:sporulation integral membrane protein YtvI